jgi:hypothetical protein
MPDHAPDHADTCAEERSATSTIERKLKPIVVQFE